MAVSIVIDVTQNSQSIANNTTNVTVKVNAKWTGGSYNLLEKSGSVTIDGTKYTFTSPFNTGRTTSGSGNLYSKTLNITHNSDGKKNLVVSASYTSGVSSGTVAASATVPLTTIPRKSTLSVANGTLGTAQTLTVTRQATSFTHTITYTCGSASGTICSKSSSTSISFTPPLTLASQNTTGTSVSIKYTITTYNGSTSVGSNNYTKTCSIPSSVKPSCTVSVSDATSCYSAFGAYVQGVSKFAVTVTPTTSYGSAIASYSVSANGSTYSKASFTTDILKTSGSLTVSATVKDKRGRSGTGSKTGLTVLAYSKPIISSFEAQRCDSDGTLNSKGAYIKVTFSSTISPLNNKNTATYKLEFKPKADSTYITVSMPNINNQYSVDGYSTIIDTDPSSTYDIRLTATDALNSTVQAAEVSTGFKFMSWRKGGTGIAFGKVAEEENAAEFGFTMRSTHGELISSPMELPEGTNLDDVTTEGHYTIGNVTLSATIQGKPLWYDGTTSTASIYVTRAGDGQQIIQRYYPCVKAEQFEISRMRYSGTWSSWMITGGCTTWNNLTIASGFEAYASDVTPKYRVNGNLVTVTGAVKPTATVTSSTNGVKFASGIASQYRPGATLIFVCQGSGINRWILTINPSGELLVSRYGTSDYVNIPTGAWLIFTATYSI